MNNKTKLTIVIIALAVVLVGCVIAALFLSGAFDKIFGGKPVEEGKTTEPTSDVADSNNTGADAEGTEKDDPAKESVPPTTSGSEQPAVKQEGDIQVGIITEDDPTLPTGGNSGNSGNSGSSSGGGGAVSGNELSFSDLLQASGN